MWATAGAFFVKHWRSIALIILISASGYSIYKLYEDNKFLTGEVRVSTDALKRCKSTRDNLSDRVVKLTENLQEIEGARQLLEDQVDQSESEIERIRRERDRLQWEIENIEIPVDCEAKFDYMIERFQFLRDEFYTEEDPE